MIGLIFFQVFLPGLAVIAPGVFSGNVAVLAACVAVAVIYFIILALIQSALQAIFQSALHLYARNGRVPEGFRGEVLSGVLS